MCSDRIYPIKALRDVAFKSIATLLHVYSVLKLRVHITRDTSAYPAHYGHAIL
jgi:hypothetical protein